MKQKSWSFLCALLCCLALTFLCASGARAAAEADIEILLNGTALTFTDAVPQIVQDRTYLPFRAVFTALGFPDERITFEPETRTVRAERGDLTVSLVIGENRVRVEQGGQTREIETDVPAFIDPEAGRTMVPARFVSEAAGYRVGWNGSTGTVLIDDINALLENNTESYHELEQLMLFERGEENLQFTGDVTLSLPLGDQRVLASGTFDMVSTPRGRFDFDTALRFQGATENFDAPGEIGLQVCGNAASGNLYFRSPTMTGMAAEGAWYHMEQTDLAKRQPREVALPLLLVELFHQGCVKGMSAPAMVELLLRSALDYDAALPAALALERLNAVLSDGAFINQGSRKVAQLTYGGLSAALTLREDEAVTGVSFSLFASADEAAMTLDLSLRDGALKAALYVTGEQSMSIALEGSCQSTAREVRGIPQGAAVVELGVDEAKEGVSQ